MNPVISDPDAERSILACMLLNTDALHNGLQRLTDGCFTTKAASLVFSAMEVLTATDKPVNRTTVKKQLESMQSWDHVGMEVLTDLTAEFPVISDAMSYIGIVWEYHCRRELQDIALKLHGRASDQALDPETLSYQTRAQMDLVLESGSGTEYPDWRTAWQDKQEALETGLSGYPDWPWPSLSEELLPLTGDNLIVIAGLSSHGKTTFAAQLAYQWASEDIPVALMSLEMSTSRIVSKLAQLRSRVSARQVLAIQRQSTDLHTDTDKGLLRRSRQAIEDIHSWQTLTIDDNPALQSWPVLKSRIEQLHRKGRARIVFIDYLGLIDLGNFRGDKSEKYREIGKSLKNLARRLEIDIVLCHQINKTAVGHKGKIRPILTDLEYGGEKDADVVIIVNQPGKYMNIADFKDAEIEKYAPCAGYTEIIPEKNRDGEAGKVLPYKFDMISGGFKEYKGPEGAYNE